MEVKGTKYEKNFTLSTPSTSAAQNDEVDYWSLLSLFFGILGLLMKVR
jgi:hypothetical protein